MFQPSKCHLLRERQIHFNSKVNKMKGVTNEDGLLGAETCGGETVSIKRW
jgi:hypothetical protein